MVSFEHYITSGREVGLKTLAQASRQRHHDFVDEVSFDWVLVYYEATSILVCLGLSLWLVFEHRTRKHWDLRAVHAKNLYKYDLTAIVKDFRRLIQKNELLVEADMTLDQMVPHQSSEPSKHPVPDDRPEPKSEGVPAKKECR